MTYKWRAGETDAVVEYAPYVMREDIDEPPTWRLTDKQIEARMVAFDPSRCGTIGGRDHHIRTGVPVCDDCQTIYLKRQAEYRARRRANESENNNET